MSGCFALCLELFSGLLLIAVAPAYAQRPAEAPAQAPAAAANRAVYLDKDGVIRWRDDRKEVTLFGANYVLPTASDYRAAGYLHADRKRMIDEDMAQFARLGWDGLRLTFWGDWEASDSAGNLIANDHLDLQDYLIARARERGIYMLFSPIQLYGSNWPDALDDTSAPGFGRHFGKARMGTDPAALAAQVNYLRQILEHVNPYTGIALKDEPALLFIELVNEPWHHPEDPAGSIRYINALTDAVRATGCRKLVLYNVSQDFRIAPAIRHSRAQGVTFGWYPSSLNSGHELEGNYLRGVDAYPDMLRQELARLPRIVYEFDSPDLRTGTMYPAMARTFRAVGAQFAAMFAYDMLQTASRNLGWQTHYLNLIYTPRKAMSAIIAAEAMRRLPRMQSYGPYPRNTRFGDFHVSAEQNLGELVSRDAFLYAGSTGATPPDPSSLRRIAGYGSSPTVSYGGEGIYFLDKVHPAVWRLEVYPDAVPVRDPFEPPSPDKLVTRAISRRWPITIKLPDLGDSFTVQPVTAGNPRTERAAGGTVTVTPGVYVLSAGGPVNVGSWPARLGHLGFAEYHPPPVDTLPPVVVPLSPSALLTGRDGAFRARVLDTTPPDSAVVFVRPRAGVSYRAYSMRPAGAYEYAAAVPGADLKVGPHEWVVTTYRGITALTFPGGHAETPTAWNYSNRASWKFDVVSPETPLPLFDPGTDVELLAFSRIGDAGRRGLFHLGLSNLTGRTIFHMTLPVDSSGAGPPDYTASLVIKDRIEARQETVANAKGVRLRLRGIGPHQDVHITLMEDDGTSWTTKISVDSTWSELIVPVTRFAIGRGVLLPQGFPGEWNYWVGAAEGRGGPGERMRPEHLERLQLSLRRQDSSRAIMPEGYGVEVEWVNLEFSTQRTVTR
ncbi:MAG TPA: hypothetical protein VH763_15565 [Gemmatimonadales bacterium]